MKRLEISPYNTRQEEYRDDPFKMLMICFMLNQTSHKQVDQIRHLFFTKFPDAESLIRAEESDIAEMIKPLGFYNRRAKAWKIFASQWLTAVEKFGGTNIPVFELEKMKGVGKYAIDSWRVFQLFDYELQPQDHVLNWYVKWALKEVERLQREGAEYKPMSVYYLHFEDDRGAINNWNRCPDYVCCVMARTQNEAIEITESLALQQKNASYIKVLGIGHCQTDWTELVQPMRTDNKNYRDQVDKIFKKIYGN